MCTDGVVWPGLKTKHNISGTDFPDSSVSVYSYMLWTNIDILFAADDPSQDEEKITSRAHVCQIKTKGLNKGLRKQQHLLSAVFTLVGVKTGVKTLRYVMRYF